MNGKGDGRQRIGRGMEEVGWEGDGRGRMGRGLEEGGWKRGWKGEDVKGDG